MQQHFFFFFGGGCDFRIAIQVNEKITFYWSINSNTHWKKGAYIVFLCCCSVIQSCPTLWNPVDWSMPGFSVLHHFTELVQTHDHWVGDTIKTFHPRHPLLLVNSIFPSIRIFSNGSALSIWWPSIRASTSASVPPMNIQDWFPLGLTGLIVFVVQGTLKGLLQHHSSKVSILFFYFLFLFILFLNFT